MCRLKHLFIKLTFLLISISVFSQEEKKEIYILFDAESKEQYSYEIGNGKIEKSKVFVKEIKIDNNIDFYVKKELLKYYKGKSKIDTCSMESFKNLKFSSLEKLRESVDKKNPLYPYKVFSNIILVEKLNNNKYLKYWVRWESYIE